MINNDPIPFQEYLFDNDSTHPPKRHKRIAASLQDPFNDKLDYTQILTKVLKDKDTNKLELKHFFQLTPHSVPSHSELLRLSGRVNEAFLLIDNGVMLNPQDAPGYAVRGLIHKQLKSDKLALQDYNEALAIDSTNLLALYNRGILLWQNQFYPKAFLDFNCYLDQIQETNITALAGEMQRLMGDYKEASAYFDIAFRDDAINPTALKGQAFIDCHENKLEKAKTLIDKFFEKNAKDSFALAILGHILLKKMM